MTIRPATLYLLNPYQRRGVGRQLMRAVVQELANARYESLVVWVLTKNPACGFYVKLGGEVLARKWAVVGGATLEKTAFFWKSLKMVGREA
ncbi:MAG: GNAT family N-acetyltransferase [Planctomycetaceae bacterium]